MGGIKSKTCVRRGRDGIGDGFDDNCTKLLYLNPWPGRQKYSSASGCTQKNESDDTLVKPSTEPRRLFEKTTMVTAKQATGRCGKQHPTSLIMVHLEDG